MTRTIELTRQEQSIIENALNAYWNSAHEQLEKKGVLMSDGTRRPLGDIETKLLEQQKELTHPLLMRFENL